ncbi:MAG TPA: hypothetical protein EYP62_04255 [Kiritimatiellae bacterium]|nr:hypothetical protein [Kiritimatiellia bacterium]
MTEPSIQIGAEGVDAARIVKEIRERVRQKRAAGAYADPVVARAERLNLVGLDAGSEFMDLYLDALRGACLVDIGDFPIEERRTLLAPMLVPLKRLIWKLLRFYTFRLWSQQNQVNSLLATGVEAVFRNQGQKIAELEKRIEELSQRMDESGR